MPSLLPEEFEMFEECHESFHIGYVIKLSLLLG